MLDKFLIKHGMGEEELLQAKKQSRVYTHKPDFTWEGVEVTRYKPEGKDWAGIVRQVIIGYQEETNFHLRYFEIAPGGHSSLERHLHSHAVTTIRGCGKAVLGETVVPLNFLDTVYVAPDTPHQFINDGQEPFGFICVVDAERDRPRELAADELARLAANPATRDVVKTVKVKMLENSDSGGEQ